MYVENLTKIANFHPPVYLTPPLMGFPLEFCIGAGSQKTRMMGLSDGRKSFRIGLAVLIQYRSVTDTQPPSHPASQRRCRSYYAQRSGVEPKKSTMFCSAMRNWTNRPGRHRQGPKIRRVRINSRCVITSVSPQSLSRQSPIQTGARA